MKFIKVVQRELFLEEIIILKKFVLSEFLLFSHENLSQESTGAGELKNNFFENFAQGDGLFSLEFAKIRFFNKTPFFEVGRFFEKKFTVVPWFQRSNVFTKKVLKRSALSIFFYLCLIQKTPQNSYF